MRADVSKINPNPFTTRPEIEGTFGVVTSTHWIATAVGMATLEKGGNAFDAAVATALDAVRLAAMDPVANTMPSILDAVRVHATEGEIINTMAEVFGRYAEVAVV